MHSLAEAESSEVKGSLSKLAEVTLAACPQCAGGALQAAVQPCNRAERPTAGPLLGSLLALLVGARSLQALGPARAGRHHGADNPYVNSWSWKLCRYSFVP